MEDAFIFLIIIIILAIFVLLCFLKWFKTRNFKGKVEDIPLPPAFVGRLAPNNALSDLVRLCENEVDGPESLLIEGNVIYTGTNDSKIVKIVNGQIEKWLHLVETDTTKAGTYSAEPKTGRPLGIRRLTKECLVVADAYHGVFKVDFQKAIVTKLYNSQTKVDGRVSRFLNDVEVLDDQRIVFTDSSSNYERRNFANALLENAPNGSEVAGRHSPHSFDQQPRLRSRNRHFGGNDDREEPRYGPLVRPRIGVLRNYNQVLEVNIQTGATRVLIGGLYFPNGIQKHPDGESLLVAETSMFRIRRYYFGGVQKGKLVNFVDNLPGLPDNIRLSSATGDCFYVGMCSIRSQQNPSFVDKLNNWPKMRRFVSAFIPKKIMNVTALKIAPKYGLVLEIDLYGQILSSFHDPTGDIGIISQACDDSHFLFLGSPHNKFIAQMPKTST